MYVDKNYIKIPETIDKANIDTILNDLAKELKKRIWKIYAIRNHHCWRGFNCIKL